MSDRAWTARAPRSPADARGAPPPVSRREWLAAGAVAAGALAAGRLAGQPAGPAARGGPALGRPGVGDPAFGAPVPGGLVVRNTRPLDAESPLGALAAPETPADLLFVRSHFGPPAGLPLDWTLSVDGAVDRPVTFSLAEIRQLAERGGHDRARAVTLECAGNGRGVFALPKTSGVQWERGAVGTATWTGVPLGALLERAGLRPAAGHLWAEALDHAPVPAVPKFLRSIPRAVALGDALVAYAMNGRPIPRLHGGPLRLVVPGWFGMASTKWLTHIHAMPVESDNYFMAHGYRYGDGSPVTVMRVKSVIAEPLGGARVRAGRLTMRGQAWSGAGAGGVRGVDVSGDGGRTWQAARLVGAEQPGAWRTWEAAVDVRSGPALLMARATDRSGAVQPTQGAPNPGGYGNNSIHQVPIHVL